MHKTIAIKLVGGLSKTSKMPGPSYGLPTDNCLTGAKLAKVPGSVCSNCYAMKGYYKTFGSTVIPAQQRRLASISDPQWVEAMVKCLEKERWFRWFDSGDLQSTQMLLDIFEIALQTPHCSHWLATRERTFVREALALSHTPDNLVVRVSGTFPDVPVRELYLDGVNYANVHKNEPAKGHECAAPKQNGKCDLCRTCWDKKVKFISYKEH